VADTVGSWRDFLEGEEAQAYQRAGFAAEEAVAFGRRAALLVVDCTIAFAGRSADLTQAAAAAEFPTACGPTAWAALPSIARLAAAFRRSELPVVFSRSDLALWPAMRGATKAGARRNARNLATMSAGNQFPEIIRPQDHDLVLEKTKASVFFGTPLAAFLQASGVDTLVVCGATTSGCVRASVVDSFSHGFTTFVVEEACFDRSPKAHQANLWDMNAKYADVVTEAAAITALAG
jgi:maleamate amidohydrolase